MEKSWRFILLALLSSWLKCTVVAQSAECTSAMFEADADGDGLITGDEYVTFSQLLGPPGFIEDTEDFNDLPGPLKLTFNYLACSACQPDDPECCTGDNASFSNAGSDPNVTPTPEEAVNLLEVCILTNAAISTTLGTTAPSISPSGHPSSFPSVSPSLITSFPTFAPSPTPSVSPVTPAPVVTPAPTTPAPVTPAPILTPAPVTPAPTVAPTLAPSGAPVTPAPVVTPAPTTLAPVTLAPITVAPTLAPTLAPITPAPTTPAPIVVTPAPVVPTLAPVVPTLTPTTLAPTLPPTTTLPPVVQTLSPVTPAPVSLAPTGINDRYAIASYQVGLRGAATGPVDSTYVDQLEAAMDLLSQSVVASTFPDGRRRKLAVSMRPPSQITTVADSECPSIITNDADACEDVTHQLTLVIVDEDDEVAVADFETSLQQAIWNGELQDTLDLMYGENTAVYVTTGLQAAPSPVPIGGDGNGGLSAGGIAGVSIAAVVVVIVAALLVQRRVQDSEPKEREYVPGDGNVAAQQLTADIERDIAVPGSGDEDPLMGAAPPDYGKKSRAAAGALYDANRPGSAGDAAESSSNAGSSGWSSSAGVSSLNTGSIDELDTGEGTGASLAAIGAASAIGAAAIAASGATKTSDPNSDEIPEVPDVSRDDLDSAIEAGDWAAVGATAALLAAASDSQSQSSRSRKTDTSQSGGASSISSLDAARAAELDHLVDAGDWEGVVMAAAKFEASEDTSTGASQEISSKTGGSSAYSSTSLSESPSKGANRDEIREEVESLVRRVVPEEIDNVDEMMLQFKGREEELVETLRTMQERQVAQKARVQGQKQAKRDARQTAREGGIPLPTPPTSGQSAESSGSGSAGAAAALGVAAAAGIAAALGGSTDEDSMDNSSSSETSSEGVSEFATAATQAAPILGLNQATSGSDEVFEEEERSHTPPFVSGEEDAMSSKKRRTALELAIEAGDWEAVGEAAAMMSDASVTTASTGEINKMAGIGAGSVTSGESTENRYKVNSERAAELDDMIDQGDWTGVVNAASRFTSLDSTTPTPPALDESAGRTTDYSSSGGPASESMRRLREEEEALAQAEVWMQIADQNRPASSEAAGASDAADWAIARSLSALKQAEETGDLDKRSIDSSTNSGGDRSV